MMAELLPSDELLPSGELRPGEMVPPAGGFTVSDGEGSAMEQVVDNSYGVDVAMTTTGDIAVSSSGAMSTVGDVSVLAQALWLRTNTEPEELPLHGQYGITSPVGSKMDPTGIAARVGSQLAEMPQEDQRFQSVSIGGVESPVGGDASAIQLRVDVVAAGGEAFEVSGLPEQATLGEVSTPQEGGGGLGAFGEELEYGAAEEAEAGESPLGSPEAVAQALNEAESEL